MFVRETVSTNILRNRILEQMSGLKDNVFNLQCCTFIDVYVGYKEKEIHLYKTLTLNLGTQKKN